MMTPIENDNKIKDETELAKTFDSHYKHPTTLGTVRDSEGKRNCYSYHSKIFETF